MKTSKLIMSESVIPYWALHFAVKSRIKGDPNLNFTNPQKEIKDIPMSQLLPSKCSVDALTGTLSSQVLDKMGLYVLGGSSWFHGISNLNWGRQKTLWGISLALVVAICEGG